LGFPCCPEPTVTIALGGRGRHPVLLDIQVIPFYDGGHGYAVGDGESSVAGAAASSVRRSTNSGSRFSASAASIHDRTAVKISEFG
jgi:hypothetical protein